MKTSENATVSKSSKLSAWQIVGQVLIGATLTGTAVIGATHIEDLTALSRKPTTQETFLENTLQNSIVKKPVRVDCFDRNDFIRQIDPRYSGDMYAHVNRNVLFFSFLGTTPVIHYPKESCERIYQYAQDQKSIQRRSRGGNQTEVTAAEDIFPFVHESQHVALDTSDEAPVNCAALQRVVDFSSALGVTDKQQQDIFLTSQYIYTLPGKDYQSSECRDGGKYDLDPNHPGKYFPAK